MKSPPKRFFANQHDESVVRTLHSAAPGKLKIDQFSAYIPKYDPIDLRFALMKVYFDAAEQRRAARATKAQIAEARRACSTLYTAARHLRNVRPPEHQGIERMFGLAPDDPKGVFELADLANSCSQIEHEVMRVAQRLDRRVRTELAKPTQPGERKKRLRSLVEALAAWWRSTGNKVTITVKASRRDAWRGRKQTAIVHGRHSKFLDLALALFSEIDVFRPSEVVSAVTNAYEASIHKR